MEEKIKRKKTEINRLVKETTSKKKMNKENRDDGKANFESMRYLSLGDCCKLLKVCLLF